MRGNSKGIGGERRTHFRGRSQVGRRIDVIYRRVDGKRLLAGGDESKTVTANIGVGGAFLLTASPEPVDSALEVCIRVPDEPNALVLRADVRWTCSNSETHIAGMGLKFEPLEVAALLLLRDYFSSLADPC